MNILGQLFLQVFIGGFVIGGAIMYLFIMIISIISCIRKRGGKHGEL